MSKILLILVIVLSFLPVVAPVYPTSAQGGGNAPEEPESQAGYFLVGPYTSIVAGFTAGNSFEATFEPNPPDNFLFDDFPIVGTVFHVTQFAGYAGNNQSRFGLGIPTHVDDYDNPSLAERLIIGNNEIRYSWDRYVCTGSILNNTYTNGSTFTTSPVCGGVEHLFPNTDFRDEWTYQGFPVIDAGYPFSVITYADCRSYSGIHSCSALIEYWLIGYGFPPDDGGGSGGGDNGLPPCPPQVFDENGLTISWMSACYHCLSGNNPEPTDIPAGTAEPTSTAFAPTPQPPEPTAPPPTATPDPSVTPEPPTPDNWFYIDGVIETSSAESLDIEFVSSLPVYAVVVEYMVYPSYKSLQLLITVDGVSSDYLDYFNEYRYFYGDSTLYAGVVDDIYPKIRVSDRFAEIAAPQPLFDMVVTPITIDFSGCDLIPQAVCSMHYRIWLLSYMIPVSAQTPLNSNWSGFGSSNVNNPDPPPIGGVGGGGLSNTCIEPEYIDEDDDGGGVGGDVIGWEIELREGDCITIVPGIDESVGGQSIYSPAVSLCPTYLDLPQIVVMDLEIPLLPMFLLPVGMFLVAFLRTL